MINLKKSRSAQEKIYLINSSKAKYIAAMDSDIICLPNRFKMQLEFLNDNPEVDDLRASNKF